LIESPTIRADGSILNSPGYDKATGLYLIPSFDLLPIPDTPTQQDARDALRILLEPMSEFRFETDADKSVAVAALLTALVRRVLPSAPLFAFDAPKPRTGKTLLTQVIAIMATGRPAAVMGYPPETIEFNKKIFAALLAGDQIICIDNVTPGSQIESDALCSALTESIVKDRILGKSENQAVAANATWFATGNNIAFARDMADRVLRCRLNAQMESPEHRETTRNPDDLKAFVLQGRAKLIQAALTILRAHHMAGYPERNNLSRLGGFDTWSDVIRGAIVWLGMADPCDTRRSVKDDDPVRNNAEGLLRSWFAMFGSDKKTAREVLEKADKGWGPNCPPEHKDLKEAVEEAIGSGKDSREFGKWLAGTCDGHYGSFVLRKSGKTSAGIIRWSVSRIE
jgi:putative DNA primase/helicase